MTLASYHLGQGPDIVLLHGWGLHSAIWENFAPQLAKYFRVTLIDLPGYGKNQLHHQEPGHLSELATRLLAVAPPRSLWLGWSLGGLIATYIAAYYPSRVQGLISIASNIKFVSCDSWPHGVDETLFTHFKQELTYNVNSTLWRFLSLSVFGAKNMQQHLRQLRALLPELSPNIEVLNHGLTLLQNTDLRPLLAQLRCPALSILGQNDALIPSNAAKQISKQYPNIKTQIIEQAAHAPFLTHPESILSLIKQYAYETIKEPEFS